MTSKSLSPVRSYETWTVFLHVIVWTAMIVGFIMALVVVFLH